jgi:hypothetical protein
VAAGGRVDWLAVAGAGTALSTAAGYVALARSQGDTPAWWFLSLLLASAATALYAARPRAVRRHAALLGAGGLLVVLGLLGLASIGAPILLAGLLCLVAAHRARSPRGASWRRSPGS